MLKLILPGTIRSKKNSKRIIPLPSKKKTNMKSFFRIGGGKRGWKYAYITIQPSKAYIEWEAAARESLYEQGWAGPAFTCQVCVKAVYYFKGRRPDLSGCHESLGDAMEGPNLLWLNDGQIERWHGDSCLIHDIKNPRTEIEVYPWKP